MAPLRIARLVLIASLLAGPALAADEIHWTIKGQTAVTFDWRGSETTIRYGTTTAYGTTVTAVTPSPVPISSPGPFWEARITGLQENTLYHYSIGSGPDHTFRTPLPRGTSDFWVSVEGDIGPGTWPRVADVQSLIAATPPSFVLAVGDLTYANDEGQQAADDHFNGVMPWSQDVAYMPTWGNHEYDEGPGMQNYKGRFDLPNAQASPGQTEEWSWFDYGNVRFISYPEWGTGTGADWYPKATALMDQAQNDPAIQFIVTFGHEPAYSSGWHTGETDLAGYLGTLGSSHSKYVLNLNGHSHDYERSYPQSGVTHITAGIGGANLEEASGSCLWVGGCPPPAWSAFRAMHHGVVRLHVTSGRIDGQMICGPVGDNGSNINDITCTRGSVVDAWSLVAPGTATACPVFPANNIWNTDISTLPVHAKSTTWVGAIGASKNLYVGFAPNTFGMRWVYTNASTPKVSITFGQVPSQSDPGPYPFTATTPLEVGTIDAHAFMVDTSTCTLYELYNASWNNGAPRADAGMVFPLASNALHHDGWPSCDDAGLPIFPGITRLEEVQAGAIRHALRFEAATAHIDGTLGAHLWPARHDPDYTGVFDSNLPPMGARFRLKGSFNISTYSPQAQVVLRALQHYGMFLADIGLDWELIGTADPNWSASLLNELQTVPASQFEVVDESSLMVDPNSAQAGPPGTADTTPPAPVADLRVRH